MVVVALSVVLVVVVGGVCLLPLFLLYVLIVLCFYNMHRDFFNFLNKRASIFGRLPLQ